MDSNTKKILIVALVFMVVFIAVFFIGRMLGKQSESTEAPSVDDIPGAKQLTDAQKLQVEQIADELYEEMDGFNLTRDTTAFENLIGLSDTLFVAVYNFWNKKYQAKEKMTLPKRMEDEWIFSSIAPATARLAETIKKRFERLKLS